MSRAILACAKASPRARFLYLLAGEAVRLWLNDRDYEALDIILGLESRTEIAFVAALLAHSFMAMDEEDLLGELVETIASTFPEDS